mgnify:CR=1 FL=1
MVTPKDKRNTNKEIRFNDFCLKDMCELHEPLYLTSEEVSTSTVKVFFKIELALRNEFSQLIRCCSFEFFPDVKALALEFIKNSISFDFRDEILSAESKNWQPSGTKHTSEVKKGLIEKGNTTYEKVIEGNIPSGNIVVPYAFLCQMMKTERTIIFKYTEEIRRMSK